MRHKIENELDFLVAKFQKETDFARGVLLRAREANDYHREKTAAKLVAFHEHEERMIMLYVEAKIHFPDLARFLEERRPHLAEFYKEAKELWSKL